MVIAAIGVALGVVLVPVIYATIALHAALGSLGMASIWGLYVVPLLVATRVMRRPWAALLTSLLVPLVQLPFGPGGWIMLLLWLPAGLACEAPFFLTRYRSLGLPTLMVAGALASLAFIAHMYLFIGFFDLALGVQVALVAVPLPSGALLGGVPAKLLSDQLHMRRRSWETAGDSGSRGKKKKKKKNKSNTQILPACGKKQMKKNKTGDGTEKKKNVGGRRAVLIAYP
jgi:energy-coupling factor transport system substrate-specific component